MWPFDRLARLFGRGKEPDSGTTARGELTSPAESNPAGDPGAHPAGEAAWRSVPAVQRVVQAMPLTTAPAKFEAGLVSWQSVAALEPLGHAVSPDAPSGSVTGLARPVAVQRSVDMPVRTTEAKPPRQLGGIARPAETGGFETGSVQQNADEAGGLVGNDALAMTTTDPVAAPSEPVGSSGASVALPLVQRTTTEAASQPAARATSTPAAAAGRDVASGSAGTTSSATEPAMGGMTPVAVQRSAAGIMPAGTPQVPTTEAPHSAAAEPAPGAAAEASGEPVTDATSESAGSTAGSAPGSSAGTTSGLVGDTALASTAAAEAAQSSTAGAPVVQRSASGALPLVTERHATGMPVASAARTGAESAVDQGVESFAPTTGLSPMSTAVPTPTVQRSASAGSAGSGPITPSRAGGSRPNSFTSASGVELPVVTVQLHAVQPTPAPAPPAALVEQATEATEVTEVSETPQAAAEAESPSEQADPEPVPTLQPIQRAISEPVTAEPPQPRRLGLGEPMHVVPRSSPPPPDTDPFEIRPVLGDQPVVQRALATAGPADSASTASPATPEPSAPAMPYVEARSNTPDPVATTPAPAVEPEPRPEPVLEPALEPPSAPDLPLAIDQPAFAIQPVLGDRGFAPLSLQRSAEPNGHAIESVHHQTPGAGTMPASGTGTGPSPVARRPNVQRSMGSPAFPGSGRGSVRPAATNGGSAAPVFVQRFDLPGLPSAPGMPAVPSLPSVPGLPSSTGMPALPSMPSMPSMPALPGMPTVPGMPALPGLPNVPAMPVTPAGVPSGLTDAASTVTDSATSAVSGLTENVTNGLSDAASAATSAMDPVVAATGSATAEGLGPGGAPGPSGGSPAGQAGAAGLAAASPSDLDELSRQLYDRIRSRLRAELRLDRERAGLLTDPYR